MLAWLNAIEAYKETGNELPINLRVRANHGTRLMLFVAWPGYPSHDMLTNDAGYR